MCTSVCAAQYGDADAVGPSVGKLPLGQTQLWHGIRLLTSLIAQALDYAHTHTHTCIHMHRGSRAQIPF